MTDVEGRWVVKFKSYDIDGKNEKEAFEGEGGIESLKFS